MQYRDANLNDVEALADLHAKSWRDSFRGIFADEFLDGGVWDDRRSVWSERLSTPKPNQRVIVASDHGEICGFICAYGNESLKWGTFIDNLHVSTEIQGRGVGKHLMYLIGKWIEESFDHKGIYLEVLEANLQARNFYHRIGARHEETNLWLPPGSHEKVNDLLYVWENHLTLLDIPNTF